MNDIIDSFSGEYRWLSNFWMSDILYEGIWYPSTEHAYQAAKTLDLDIRKKMATMVNLKKPIQSGNVVKHAGNQLVVRPDWEHVKYSVMKEVITYKFENNDELARKLIDTYPAELIEGNWWHDTYWGVCNNVGLNNLGKILMEVRAKLMLVGETVYS